MTEVAIRNYEEERQAEHAEFCGNFFRMLRSINEQLGHTALTGVTFWGVNDVTPNAGNTYVWKLNGTWSGLLTEKGKIKTSFDAIYDALK